MLGNEENQTELQNLNVIDCTPENYSKSIKKRPSIGCRALVKRSLQVLNIVLHEMEEWKEDVRLHATKLLMQIVIHSEEHLASKYYDINAVLCKKCNYTDNCVQKQAIEVAELIGHFVDQKTWSKYVFEELRTRQS
jgi:dynein assembly factor 5